jgi:hypothetical protein
MTNPDKLKMLDFALAYAREGLPIFPLASTSKKPFAGSHGHLDATCDEEKIRAWWTQYPAAAIGMPTGTASGRLVVESDPRHGGHISLAVMEEQYETLPETLEVRSGGGGRHLYFQSSNGIRCAIGKLGPGIDVKAAGGYVVLPPSLHASGRRYEWVNEGTPIAPLPEWLQELLKNLHKQPAGQSAPGARIPKGQQHAFLLSRAGEYRQKGDDQQVIESKLRIDYLQRCEGPHGPPWKRGDLIAAMAEDICKRYAPGQAVPSIGADEVEEPEDLQFADMPDDALDGRLGEICQKYLKDFPRSVAWASLVTAAGVTVPESCQPYVRTNLYTALVAPPHAGKSQAIQSALAVAEVKPPLLVEMLAGSAEGLAKKIGAHGQARLLSVDELSHLLAKSAIDRASFPYFLNNAYYKNSVSLMIAGQKELKFDARLSVLGGIVTENFEQSFGHATVFGLYDRFIFALWPSGFDFDFVPFDGKPAEENPCAVTIARDVWEVKKQWKNENRELGGRIFENALRVSVICAAWDGRPELRSTDLTPARAFAEYQLRVRGVLRANPGENLDARCAFAILELLKKHQKFIKQRDVYNAIHASRFGPGAFKRAVDALVYNEDIEQLGTHPKYLKLLRDGEIDTESEVLP